MAARNSYRDPRLKQIELARFRAAPDRLELGFAGTYTLKKSAGRAQDRSAAHSGAHWPNLGLTSQPRGEPMERAGNICFLHPAAERLMKLAGHFQLPILTFVDTQGAYPGVGAEQRGQAEAIARTSGRTRVWVIAKVGPRYMTPSSAHGK